MLKYVLMFLVFTAFSQTAPDSSDNFDDLQAFLQSFMNSYTGQAYPMSTCLTTQIQQTLNQNLAATYGYILTLNYEGLKNSYEQFLYTLGMSCELCGLNQVQVSLKNGLDQKGEFWYELNFMYNSKQVVSLFESFATKYKSQDWQGAGSVLGQLTGILIPFNQGASNLSLSIINTDGYLQFWKGLVNGLMVNPRKPGVCSSFILKFANTTIQPVTDINKMMQGDKSGYYTFFGDLANALSAGMTGYTGGCNFDLLEEELKQLATTEGLQVLATRYISNIVKVDAGVTNIKNCNVNAYTCGLGFGTVIRYLANWSIQ